METKHVASRLTEVPMIEPDSVRKLRQLRERGWGAKRIARELGALVSVEGRGKVAVVTGGGSGVMEAANRGAFESDGPSAAFGVKAGRPVNAYASRGLDFAFDNFATRKMALRRGAMGFVYFPRASGARDDIFEVLMLMQSGAMPRTSQLGCRHSTGVPRKAAKGACLKQMAISLLCCARCLPVRT